jgi:hypothetical protein
LGVSLRKGEEMKNKYPLLSLLIIHMKINDANQWYEGLKEEEREVIESEVQILIKNAKNPKISHHKERMMFFEIVAFFGIAGMKNAPNKA